MGTAPMADLLADIGGTNARFALLQDGMAGPVTTLEVAAYPTFADAARDFMSRAGGGMTLHRAAIAAAGPVVAGRVHLTNASWTIDGGALAADLGLAGVRLVNDFEALAHALPALGAEDLAPLGGAEAVHAALAYGASGPRVVLGPGTGFGVSALVPAPGGEVAVVTEGGHVSLAADTEEEAAVIAALRARVPDRHVSVETVLCGPGLPRLYAALAAVHGEAADMLAPEAIVTAALNGTSRLCRRTLAMFCAMLGGAAGNAALLLGARGGVFVGGGLVRHFAGFLAESEFRARFEAKGMMSAYLVPIPTVLIRHPFPAFPGLARLLAR
jgi:glucokinase